MALDSFRRDFGLDGVPSTTRDTIQGNIVSTFQVLESSTFHSLSTLTVPGWMFLRCSVHLPNRRKMGSQVDNHFVRLGFPGWWHSDDCC